MLSEFQTVHLWFLSFSLVALLLGDWHFVPHRKSHILWVLVNGFLF